MIVFEEVFEPDEIRHRRIFARLDAALAGAGGFALQIQRAAEALAEGGAPCVLVLVMEDRDVQGAVRELSRTGRTFSVIEGVDYDSLDPAPLGIWGAVVRVSGPIQGRLVRRFVRRALEGGD